jgi:hypothetical protein
MIMRIIHQGIGVALKSKSKESNIYQMVNIFVSSCIKTSMLFWEVNAAIYCVELWILYNLYLVGRELLKRMVALEEASFANRKIVFTRRHLLLQT